MIKNRPPGKGQNQPAKPKQPEAGFAPFVPPTAPQAAVAANLDDVHLGDIPPRLLTVFFEQLEEDYQTNRLMLTITRYVAEQLDLSNDVPGDGDEQ